MNSEKENITVKDTDIKELSIITVEGINSVFDLLLPLLAPYSHYFFKI